MRTLCWCVAAALTLAGFGFIGCAALAFDPNHPQFAKEMVFGLWALLTGSLGLKTMRLEKLEEKLDKLLKSNEKEQK